MLNALWMSVAWSLEALRPGPAPDVVIIGTDPILSLTAAWVWKVFRPSTKIAHWCFDLYPEAAFADGLLRRRSLLARIIRPVLNAAYSACDLVVDIGSCMRTLLQHYPSVAVRRTLVPWALEEPASALAVAEEERHEIFGDASLAIMYSGTFGRAHDCEGMVELAREFRDDARFAFSVRGNREKQLRNSISQADTNIRFVPFASADKLQDRLAAADIHVVSLRPEWTGTVVPSKFFGALAIGRPVLFFGSDDSAIAGWIRDYKVGWVWGPERTREIVAEMHALSGDAAAMEAMRVHCHAIYQRHFSKSVVSDGWNVALRGIVEEASEFCGSEFQPAHD